MTRREKLLQMIDLRMKELIEIESYELCAKIRDWRKEVEESVEYIPTQEEATTETPATTITIKIIRYEE